MEERSLYIMGRTIIGMLIVAAIAIPFLVAQASIVIPPPPPGPVDQDLDGVTDDIDVCSDTVNDPEPNEKHYSWLGGETFTTKDPKTKQLVSSEYTLQQTQGCSCLQILEQKSGEDNGEEKYGCTKGIMDNYIKGLE